jgi:integrase
VENDRLYALWVVLVATGMRRGEALGLRWSDVDLRAATIAIRRARVVVDGWHVAETEPKTAKGRRIVPLDSGTVAVLSAHRKAQLAERLRADNAWDDSDLLFVNEVGTPIHPQTITRRFGAIAREAGLPVMPLHSLRHTSATLALAAGIHPSVVQHRLGHSTVSLTLDVYTHAVQSVEADAAAKPGALIHPSSPAGG